MLPYKVSRRDRAVVAASNLLLRLASPAYRVITRAAMKSGLNRVYGVSKDVLLSVAFMRGELFWKAEAINATSGGSAFAPLTAQGYNEVTEAAYRQLQAIYGDKVTVVYHHTHDALMHCKELGV